MIFWENGKNSTTDSESSNSTAILHPESNYDLGIPVNDRSEGDIVVVNNRNYIIHKSAKDETVFTIATKYHVTINDLYKANKDVLNNLKENTVLLIPVFTR